jgi:branched-chain amino acid transport system permease protein
MRARLRAGVESGYVGLAILALVLLVVPLGFSNHYQYDVAMKIGLNAIVAVGLNLLIGYARQVSLGHAGFFAIGAYASAILPQRYHVPGGLALILGAVAAGLLAWAVARPILRLTGHYLVMATLGLGIIIAIVINREIDITGGPDGMAVQTLTVFGKRLRDPEIWYWIIAAALLIVVWLSLHLMLSAFGRALRALADSHVAAETVGIDTAGMKARVFVLSAVIAAIAGSLFACAERFVTPSEAGFHRSIELVTMVVVGGMGSTFGAVVGAGLLTLLPQALSGFEQWHSLLFGVILVSVMIFLPRGLVPSLCQRFAERRQGGDVPPESIPVAAEPTIAANPTEAAPAAPALVAEFANDVEGTKLRSHTANLGGLS